MGVNTVWVSDWTPSSYTRSERNRVMTSLHCFACLGAVLECFYCLLQVQFHSLLVTICIVGVSTYCTEYACTMYLHNHCSFLGVVKTRVAKTEVCVSLAVRRFVKDEFCWIRKEALMVSVRYCVRCLSEGCLAEDLREGQ